MVAPGFAPPACDACKERRGRAFSAAWHGAWLFPENPLFPIPCFRSRIHLVHSRGVVIKGIDGLKSAVRPFGLNQPLITVTQPDAMKVVCHQCRKCGCTLGTPHRLRRTRNKVFSSALVE